MLLAGLTTWSLIPRSWRWPGRGCGGNRGAHRRVDGMTANYIEYVRGVGPFVTDLRAELKVRRFIPLPVREWMIPKSSGKLRRLGIPTVRDRVVQAALKLVLGTDLRGRLPAVFARLPASASGAGCPR
jgi:hypothetical protein